MPGLVAHYRQRMAMLPKTSPLWLHGYTANVRHEVIDSSNWLVLGGITSRGKSQRSFHIRANRAGIGRRGSDGKHCSPIGL